MHATQKFSSLGRLWDLKQSPTHQRFGAFQTVCMPSQILSSIGYDSRARIQYQQQEVQIRDWTGNAQYFANNTRSVV